MSCLDQTSLAVVHRLSKKMLPSETEDLPSLPVLRRVIAGFFHCTINFEKGVLGRTFQSQVSRMQDHPRRYVLGGLEKPRAVDDEDIAAVLQVDYLVPDTTSVEAGLNAKVRGLTVGKNDLLKFTDGSVALICPIVSNEVRAASAVETARTAVEQP